MRKVWLLKAPVSAGAGAVVQVPTQCWFSGISSLPISRGDRLGKSYARAYPFAIAKRGRSRTPCSSCFIRSRSGIANSYNDNPAAAGADARIDIIRIWQFRDRNYVLREKGFRLWAGT